MIIIGLGLMTQAPRKVMNSFDQKYSRAECISWSFVDDHYHASFEHFGQQKIAVFRYNGEWLKTLVILEPKELMFCIRDYIKHTYKDATVGNVFYVITPEICEYHIYLKRGEGEDVCLEEDPLIFDENCEFLRKPDKP
ncbi:MAG: hypothetical protein ABJG47_17215 [Ekhidna sp.]